MAEQQQRPLLRSAALNTTLPSGALRVAEKQANQQQGHQQENGKQLDMQQEVERRRQRREAEAAEKAARVREMRLQAAAAKAAPSKSDGGFDPSGKAADVPGKAHSRAAAASSSRSSSVERSVVSGRQVANRSSKPAASTQSTDGSRSKAERLSISSKPASDPVALSKPKSTAEAEAELTAQLTSSAPYLADQSLQQCQPQERQQLHVNVKEKQAQQIAQPTSGGAACGPVSSQASEATLGTSSRQPGSRQSASAASSPRAPFQPPSGAARMAPAAAAAAAPRTVAREGASKPMRVPPRPSLGGAQRVVTTGNTAAVQRSTAMAPARQGTALAAPPAGPSAPVATSSTDKAEGSGPTAAELEERHAELALGHCSTLCLKWVNATIDAALAGPAYEGQPLPASQLPVHSIPAAATPEEQLQQLEAVLAQLLDNLQRQHLENTADKACLKEELAKAGSLPLERRRELEESLRLVAAFEHDLLRGRSTVAQCLQQAQARRTWH